MDGMNALGKVTGGRSRGEKVEVGLRRVFRTLDKSGLGVR